ncbi:MAG: hypothetical protein J4215_03015 [Candidatus Diapherotrites archaeon]|uniref:Uncharacterized protein n=1 Tax=Candidatus Iainarchaeum sp. TaxID=3101447 RepID=A0A8T4L2G5_9ARCH|nr:hypothetical protein [Candidatus Diapherotrites archaeon]
MSLVVLFEKLLVLVATLVVVAGTIILIDGWRNEYLFAFFFTGQWENFLYLVAFSFSVGFLLKKLAQMEFHNLFVARKGRLR